MQSKTELAALLDDLRWCFDTPANTVIELALLRLGVPEFYSNFLNDIDLHSVKSTITADGITLHIFLAMGAEGTHDRSTGRAKAPTRARLTGCRLPTWQFRWHGRRVYNRCNPRGRRQADTGVQVVVRG